MGLMKKYIVQCRLAKEEGLCEKVRASNCSAVYDVCVCVCMCVLFSLMLCCLQMSAWSSTRSAILSNCKKGCWWSRSKNRTRHSPSTSRNALCVAVYMCWCPPWVVLFTLPPDMFWKGLLLLVLQSWRATVSVWSKRRLLCELQDCITQVSYCNTHAHTQYASMQYHVHNITHTHIHSTHPCNTMCTT